MPRTYVRKGPQGQGCSACGARRHNARSPLCPANVAKAAAALLLEALVEELEERAPVDVGPASAAVGLVREAARAAAAKVVR